MPTASYSRKTVILSVLLCVAAGAGAQPQGPVTVLEQPSGGAGGVAAAETPQRQNLRCRATQRLLSGAIELYNLDRNTRRTDMGPLCTDLVRSGYLGRLPQDPGQGSNSAGNFYLTQRGNGLSCRVHGSEADAQACTGVRKTVAGAIEMYNLDKNTRRSDLGTAFFGELQRDGYLKEMPEDPGQGSNSANHFIFIPRSPGVGCTVHGE
jgi:competence protein ComGC